MTEHGAAVVLEGIEKRYGSTAVLQGVHLEIAAGEFVSLLGPSGSGKTTTLRIVAGLVDPTGGRVYISGRDVTGVPSHRRNLAMVFQQYALFPHMTVEENVWFGLRMRGVDRHAATERVLQALELVRMADYRARYPSQLSGGQQQRVGLARCLVVNPAVLLLDEPFGAIDRQLREGMQRELRELQQRLGITTLFVTHDQEEALSLSDRVVVMNGGRIEQVGVPKDVYRQPASLFVASFVGSANTWHGRCVEVTSTHTTIEVLGQKVTIGPLAIAPDTRLVIVVRPEDVGPADRSDRGLTFTGTVSHEVFKGSSRMLVVKTESGADALALIPDNLTARPHTQMAFTVPLERVVVFVSPAL